LSKPQAGPRRIERQALVSLLLAVAGALAPAASTAAAAPNLIRDGGFERPPVAVGGSRLYSLGQTFGGWRVVGLRGNVAVSSGSLSQDGLHFAANAGRQWLNLAGRSGTLTGVAQTVRTRPGERYRLSFAVGNVVDRGGAFGTSSTVNVLVNGRVAIAVRNSDGGKTQTWKTYALTMKAASAATTIAFVNGDAPADGSNGLDSVSLTRANRRLAPA
jgi:hypothetical protein